MNISSHVYVFDEFRHFLLPIAAVAAFIYDIRYIATTLNVKNHISDISRFSLSPMFVIFHTRFFPFTYPVRRAQLSREISDCVRHTYAGV